jgi:hypothetical protein
VPTFSVDFQKLFFSLGSFSDDMWTSMALSLYSQFVYCVQTAHKSNVPSNTVRLIAIIIIIFVSGSLPCLMMLYQLHVILHQLPFHSSGIEVQIQSHLMRFEVLKMLMLVLWVLTPCGFVGRYLHFRGTYCLHLQGWCLPTCQNGCATKNINIENSSTVHVKYVVDRMAMEQDFI